MKFKLLLFLTLFCGYLSAQDITFEEKNITINKHVEGTLTVPLNSNNSPLAIIIGGSGPTDRDGNQNFLKNDALKKLAHGLSIQGIATFRYDKRVVKQIRTRNIDPDITFDDFVEDAISVIDYFKTGYTHSKIYLIGHSQGSLVGMIASKEKADGFISLAGAGQNIGNVLIDQVSKTAPQFTEDTKKAVESLKEGKLVKNYPQALASIFREDIQPFMINWMKYEPTEIIKTLEIPTLIINGTKDLQVSVEEAKTLNSAALSAQLEIIENMNHVLVPIDGDDLENSKSYNEPYRKISEDLISNISTFILSND